MDGFREEVYSLQHFDRATEHWVRGTDGAYGGGYPPLPLLCNGVAEAVALLAAANATIKETIGL